MKPLFWVALNFIGFITLVFIYINTDKARTEKTLNFTLFRLMQIIIMLYLVFDTGMYLLDGIIFNTARIFLYIFSILYYLTVPLPGLIYLLYCDNNVYNDGCIRKRLWYYLLPAAVSALLVISTPLTKFIFYINENNLYMRGNCLWITLFISFIYVAASYPLLAVKTSRKRALAPKGTGIYLYLFQIPPFVLAVIQLLNYGQLLLGMGFVISVFLMYIYIIQSSEDKRRLSVRFFNISITQFALVSFIMIALMLWTLEKIIDDISQDYAVYNTVSTANTLKTYLNKEIGVLGTAANSNAVISWLTDENDPEKKRAAYDELTATLRHLYNKSLYIVAGKTGNEYSIEGESSFENFSTHASISGENPNDAWVYELMASDHEYNLNVDIDKELYRKRVWLNYKVMKNGESAGIVCSGMDFMKMAEQAFSKYDINRTRALVIDENGVICMDSALLRHDDFLLFGITNSIFDETPDPAFHAAVQKHLESIDGYFQELDDKSLVVKLNKGRYEYASIAPIGKTNWSLIKFFDSSLFSPFRLLPPFFILIILFFVFVFNSNRTIKQMIFNPLQNLVKSLVNMKESNEHEIYGMDRNDEIGLLSNTIHDLFVKGHYDGLTGIYNRRYMETTFSQYISTLSRSETKISVMMIDIDFFKKYNDTYGHSQGDECLKIIAKTLNNAILRRGDFVARYGGEEFAVILTGTDESGACIMAEKMLKNIRDLEIPNEKNNDSGIVTVSIGVTTSDFSKTQNWNEYVEKADKALYLSKNNGRNRYTFLAFE
ncbi:MAG: GGDEF domain-containing protein [Treponema sp.]|nr:GGDEF domain-containing protein [Treponema sp.]MCL2272243.1 GGDEF domain-containing protein [Treponema sp.]